MRFKHLVIDTYIKPFLILAASGSLKITLLLFGIIFIHLHCLNIVDV